MAWRGLHLSKASRLSLSDGQIVVSQDDGDVRLPIEDLAWIVLDTPQATVTTTLLAACSNAGIPLVVVDTTHTPSGILLPFHRHYRQAEIAHTQIGITAPFKKRLWQAIIRAKIENQASALAQTNQGGTTTLREMARHVGSGDPKNVEARAARYYWGQLFREFRREDDGDRRNKLLNYGYAILRSGIARALVASGLLPCFGLMHASVTNPFNLADDLIEPFRPFVDLMAWKVSDEGLASRAPLTLADKRAMTAILLGEANLGTDIVTLLVAMERVAAALVKAMEGGTADVLELPSLSP